MCELVVKYLHIEEKLNYINSPSGGNEFQPDTETMTFELTLTVEQCGVSFISSTSLADICIRTY